MTQFQSIEEGTQVNGQTIMAVVAGLSTFRSVALGYLENAGLAAVVADDRHWYPQQAWLDAFRLIADRLGDNVLFRIGKKIPENAVFPKDIDTVEKALASIDVAYHMNHRNGRNEVLFDPSRPRALVMLEGIGHYRFQGKGQRSAIVVCDNPYPCAFDRGIIDAMAKRFSSGAEVTHVDTAGCRRKGAHSCTYAVSW